ncbi:unnamed protein product (macronuclear) [Paramecium tetraurelia]|uniref:Uncharacterized protein n=1 Tax=Paramecium tetraurelia TaxID=5888 RepID=A0DSU2_PARTE|nr:uncharacterized protein GSPATT00019802001 [Paramecium tetraurelia]CAK86109.1 unnamed protein product [Paramecium tetraurelia]|eukprot:XP_001453506.1 hypothetical protein (macronuclear) [Paramecium tetraurelia strain d4-2]
MKQSAIGMNKSANLSRQSSFTSQTSNSDKKNKTNSYVSISPRFDPEKGLSFENSVKEVKIKSQDVDTDPQQQNQNKQNYGKLKKQSSFTLKTQKDDQMKKSKFSRNQRADSLSPQKLQ